MSITSRSLQRVSEEEPFPITLKEHGVEFLMEHRHLWIRTPRQSAILRIRAEIIKAARDFLDDNGFVLTDPPILTPAACEGTSTLFPVDYFGDEAYLTQSGQLYIESTALALGKVYSFGPTFRAEKSKTRRHLTEFWMVEPELAYATLDDLMVLAEEFLSFLVQRVLTRRALDLKVLGRDTAKLEACKPPFPRITYDEAVSMLNDAHARGLLEQKFEYGNDFGSPDETYLSAQFDRPVMVHRYPAAVKAFYMEPDAQNPKLALCVDVLAPEGYGEDHRRLAAHRLLRSAEETDRRAPATPRSVFLVSGSPPLWLGSPLRLRHGHRARGGVDMRSRPCAGNDSFRAHAQPNLSLKAVTRSPRRFCLPRHPMGCQGVGRFCG